MRILIFLLLSLGVLPAQADEVLLDSYSTTVRSAKYVLFAHDAFDSKGVRRLTLWKTSKPLMKNGVRGEEVVYAVGVRDAIGNIVNEEFITKEKYEEYRATILTLRENTPWIGWTHGCAVNATTTEENFVRSLKAACPENKNPAIEAGSAETVR